VLRSKLKDWMEMYGVKLQRHEVNFVNEESEPPENRIATDVILFSATDRHRLFVFSHNKVGYDKSWPPALQSGKHPPHRGTLLPTACPGGVRPFIAMVLRMFYWNI